MAGAGVGLGSLLDLFIFALFFGSCVSGCPHWYPRLCAFLMLQKGADPLRAASGWDGESRAPKPESPIGCFQRPCDAGCRSWHPGLWGFGLESVLGANGGKERMCR